MRDNNLLTDVGSLHRLAFFSVEMMDLKMSSGQGELLSSSCYLRQLLSLLSHGCKREVDPLGNPCLVCIPNMALQLLSRALVTEE